MTPPKTRNSNFELLRLLSITLILIMHIYSQIAHESKILAFNDYLGIIINSISNIGVTCFVLISGYFGIKWKKEKFLQLILLTTGYSLLLYFINNNNYHFLSLLKSLLIVPLYKNWFITCYLIVMLLSPYLNKVMEIFDKKEMGKLLLIMFFVFSVFPTLFNTPFYTILSDGGKCLTYFIFIYLIGRYLRLYQDIVLPKRKTFSLFILMTFAIIFLNVTIGYIFNKKCYIYSMDCSPFILISALSVFYLFKSIQFKSKFVNYLAASVVAIYLLDAFRLFIDRHFIHLANYTESYFLIFFILLETFIVIISTIAIDKIRIAFFSGYEKRFIHYFFRKDSNIL